MRGRHTTVALSAAAGWIMTAATAGLAMAADGPATQPAAAAPDPQQMMAQIHQLQEKVDRLEAKEAAPAAPGVTPGTLNPEQSTQYHRAGDTDPIDSFKPAAPGLTTGPTGEPSSYIAAGWNGNQFSLHSADQNFTLHPGLIADIRDMTSYRERVPAKGGGSEVTKSGYDTQNGFDVTRLRLIFDGTLFHQVSYLVQLSADQGASLTLLDAAATYRFGDSPFSVKAGQFKDPVWHERNLSEANLMGVDRSLVEQFLAGGQGSRIQGAAVTYDQDRTRAQIVYHDGFDSQNTKFFDAGGVPSGIGGAAGVSPTDFGASARAEYMLIGQRTAHFNPYSEYDQFTSLNAKQDILVVGAGADYSQAGSNDLILHSADIQYNQVGGFSAYAGYYGTYRKINTNQGVSPAGFYYDVGFEGQVAYLIGGHFEPFARYDYTHFDPSSTKQVTGLATHVLQEITVGANYYVYGQKLKLTVDGNFLPNGSPADADAAGVLKDSGNNEFVFRGQLQLAI